MEHLFLTDDERAVAHLLDQAVEAKDLMSIKDWLDQHIDILRKPMTDGCEFSYLDHELFHAGMSGNLEFVKLLVSYGADINAWKDDTEREGVICHLFVDGDQNIEVVRWLLQHGAAINHERNGQPTSASLISAAMDGALEGAKLLIEHGAVINGLSRNKATALDFATIYGHKEVADYLISQGALPGWQVRGESPPQPSPIPKTFRDHLVARLHDVDEVSLQELIPTGFPLRIHRAHVESEYFLITEGVSSQPMNTLDEEGAKDLRYAEVMIRLPDDWPLTPEALGDPNYRWPIEWLFKMARWPHENNTWYGKAAIFANGEPPQPFADNTQLSCMMVVPPHHDFSTWQRPDGETVTIYALHPIYTEERDFGNEHGVRALLERFREGMLPLCVVPDRENVALW